MPVQTFTATPQLNKPLPKRVTSYLKLAVPAEEMTQEWLNYSLSVLQPSKSADGAAGAGDSDAPAPVEEEPAKFHFSIPYKNGQRKILVRRVNSRKRGEPRLEDHAEQMKYALTFGEVARRRGAGDGGELVDPEVESILTEMIDSVAMSFSEDSFIRDDPDLTYQVEMPVKPMRRNHLGGGLGPANSKASESSMGNTTSSQGANSKSRVTLCWELKRLNVTIIDTAQMVQSGE